MISLFNTTRLSLPKWNQAIPFDSFVHPLLKKQPVYLQHFRVVFAIYVLVFWLVFPSQGDITAKKCSLQKLSCLIAKTENLSSLGEHLLFPPHKMLANVSLSTRKKINNCYFHLFHSLALQTKSMSLLKISSVLPCPLAEKQYIILTAITSHTTAVHEVTELSNKADYKPIAKDVSFHFHF